MGLYYLLENIIHYYFCQSEGGEDSSQGGKISRYHDQLHMQVYRYTN